MTTIQNQSMPSSLMSSMNGAKVPAGSASATSAAAAAASANSTQGIKDNFMKMLVAQMQYQDPTQPVDSAQMTSQLAQLSSVDGINKLNDSMASMVSSLQSSQAYQASTMIGHTVMVSGSSLQLTKGQGSFSVQLPSSADKVSVNVLNASGQTVKTINLGSQSSGTNPVAWNGKDVGGNTLPDGAYTLQVMASSGGKPISASAATYATVNSVSNIGGSVVLNLNNNTSVGAANVMQIL